MSSVANSRAHSGAARRLAGCAAALACLLPMMTAAQVAATAAPPPVNGGPADPASPGAAVIKPLESVVPNPASKGQQRELAAVDGRLLQRAHAGLQARIDLSRLAAADGTHPCVKKLAEGVVEDYGELMQEVEVLAAARHLTLSGPLPAAERQLLAALQRLVGPAFDRRYAVAMRDAHARDLAFVKREGARAVDSEVKALAKTLRAKFAERQGMARELATVVGGSTAESAGAAMPLGCAMF